MKLKIAILFILCSLLPRLYAQRDSSATRIFSFVPQYVFINGVRFDYDRKINERSWLQFSVEGFANEKSDVQAAWQKEKNYELAGLGLGLYYRYYLNDDAATNFGTYLATGISENFFKFNNSNYESNVETTSSTKVWRSGVNLVIGQEYRIADRLMLDFYAGMGYRYSNNHYSNKSAETNFRFDDNMFSYGFTGNVLLLGFRVGYLF